MILTLDKNLFGKIYPYIEDENVTDIKWNGTTLWINDLNKGRYMAVEDDGTPIKLENDWITIFCSRIANSVNENFNISEPSLKAETPELRIQAEHNSVSGDNTFALAIRKTPRVSRLAHQDLVANGYADKLTYALLPCLMRARLSGVITGDVGSGKTELTKYMCSFIPKVDGVVTVEDTSELRLKELYPNMDIYPMRITESFTADSAIRDALRLMTKWLIIAEARGREITRVMEGASTGCAALTSIHAENTWEIPDRIMNMAGDDARKGFENDVYSFFDYAIKVKAEVTDHGIFRSIDQIAFFVRYNGKNTTVVFMKNGKLTGERLPKRVESKLQENKEREFLKMYVEAISELQKSKENKA